MVDKLLFFFSSFLPLTAAMAVVERFFPVHFKQSGGGEYVPFLELNGQSYGILFHVFLLLVILGVIGTIHIWLLRRTRGSAVILQLDKVSRKDGDQLGFIFSYMIPIGGVVDQTGQGLMVSVLFIFFFLFAYVSLDVTAINPTMTFLGYYLFEAETKEGESVRILARKELQSDTQIGLARLGDSYNYIEDPDFTRQSLVELPEPSDLFDRYQVGED